MRSPYETPTYAPDSNDWRSDALCRQMDPEVFFPSLAADLATAPLAKRVCGLCSVRTQCLRDAIATGDVHHGIRGGCSPQERYDISRGRAGRTSARQRARREAHREERAVAERERRAQLKKETHR